jgi:hypothetical protein
MAKLCQCYHCGGQVSSVVSQCPHCGTAAPHGYYCHICKTQGLQKNEVIQTFTHGIVKVGPFGTTWAHPACVAAIHTEVAQCRYKCSVCKTPFPAATIGQWEGKTSVGTGVGDCNACGQPCPDDLRPRWCSSCGFLLGTRKTPEIADLRNYQHLYCSRLSNRRRGLWARVAALFGS